MTRTEIREFLPYTIKSAILEIPGSFYQGKVRDTYRNGDILTLIASDRISAFDHILRQTIPFKGQVLNQLAAFFFDATTDIVDNHVLEVPDPNVTIARACTPFPIEFVVRGYLAGHAWRVYKSGERELCGVRMPYNLIQNSPFPKPILTPATKAVEGHDEDISRDQIVKLGILDPKTLEKLADISLSLFARGTELASKQGLILVDTKYEFGHDSDGKLYVIDEIHTPDSSRYFYADTYEELLDRNEPQRQLSKEFVREWLMDKGFQGLEGQALPDLPDPLRVDIAIRYIELFEKVTGNKFVPDTNKNPLSRIYNAITSSRVFSNVESH